MREPTIGWVLERIAQQSGLWGPPPRTVLRDAVSRRTTQEALFRTYGINANVVESAAAHLGLTNRRPAEWPRVYLLPEVGAFLEISAAADYHWYWIGYLSEHGSFHRPNKVSQVFALGKADHLRNLIRGLGTNYRPNLAPEGASTTISSDDLTDALSRFGYYPRHRSYRSWAFPGGFFERSAAQATWYGSLIRGAVDACTTFYLNHKGVPYLRCGSASDRFINGLRGALLGQGVECNGVTPVPRPEQPGWQFSISASKDNLELLALLLYDVPDGATVWLPNNRAVLVAGIQHYSTAPYDLPEYLTGVMPDPALAAGVPPSRVAHLNALTGVDL